MTNSGLIDRLREASEKWSGCRLTATVDSLRGHAEGLVEQSRRCDAGLKALGQRAASLGASDGDAIPKGDYGRLVRQYQKEFEEQSRRFVSISGVLTAAKDSLSRAPEIQSLMHEAERAFEMNPQQAEVLDLLRTEIEALSFEDSTIEELKRQTCSVRQARDSRIRRIQSDSARRVEAELSHQTGAIEDAIRAAEEGKRELQGAVARVRDEIATAEGARGRLEEADRIGTELSGQLIRDLETALGEARERFDMFSARDLGRRLAQARSELSRIRAEIETKRMRFEALRVDYAIMDGPEAGRPEGEARALEERLREAEGDLAAAPCASEWESARAELRVRRVVDRSTRSR